MPRTPIVPGRERFEVFADAGRKLSEAHIGYEEEEVETCPLTEHVFAAAPADEYEWFAVKKMKCGGKAGAWDKTTIRYNDFVDIAGIPEDAQRYMLGGWLALDWIIERYQVKINKASGFVNDPNNCSREHKQPRYIIDLISHITTVSLDTIKTVDTLPKLGLD